MLEVRKMREQDLEFQLDLPESEHEDSRDEIRLPLPIPMEKNLNYKVIEHKSHHHSEAYLMQLKRRFSILRDKCSLDRRFYSFVQMNITFSGCFRQRKWSILTGNPGVSKSWFPWKWIFLLLSEFALSVLALKTSR